MWPCVEQREAERNWQNQQSGRGRRQQWKTVVQEQHWCYLVKPLLCLTAKVKMPCNVRTKVRVQLVLFGEGMKRDCLVKKIIITALCVRTVVEVYVLNANMERWWIRLYSTGRRQIFCDGMSWRYFKVLWGWFSFQALIELMTNCHHPLLSSYYYYYPQFIECVYIYIMCTLPQYEPCSWY